MSVTFRDILGKNGPVSISDDYLEDNDSLDDNSDGTSSVSDYFNAFMRK